MPNVKPAVLMRVFRVSNRSLDLHYEAQLSAASNSGYKLKYELASKRASGLHETQLSEEHIEACVGGSSACSTVGHHAP